MEIGAQLVTVGKACTNLDDFAETLKRVADMGYKYVQVSGTCDYTGEWLAENLKKNGLKCPITHTNKDKIIGETKKVCEEHAKFDCDNIGLGWYGFGSGSIEEFTSLYLEPAKVMKENGKYFMYHNHDSEFIKRDGKIILEHLAEIFSPDIMGFTLDTFWIQVGGGDPAYWIEKLSGRVPCIHLKDYEYGRKMAVIGEGNLNFDRIFEKAEAAGTKYMFVEQDDCNGEDPFDCLKRSYDYLKAQGF